MKTIAFVICSILLTVRSNAGDTPIGIPEPSWPDIGNPIKAVAPTPPASWTENKPGIYYVESGGTNNNEGYPGNPRGSIPRPIPAGAHIFINGTYNVDHSYSYLSGGGTSASPSWILSFNPLVPCKITAGWKFYGGMSYLILDNLQWDWSETVAGGTIEIYGANHVCFRNGSTRGKGTETGTDSTAASNISSIVLQGTGAYGGLEHLVFYKMNISRGGNWQYASGDPDAQGLVTGPLNQDIWVLDCEFSYFSGCGVLCTSPSNISDSAVARRVYVGGCTGHHIAQAAFWSKRSQDCVFSQNTAYTIRRNTPSAPNAGGLGGQYGPRNFWIIFNTVYDCQSGVQINSGTNNADGITDTDVYIIGNVFYDIHDKDGVVDNWRGNAYSQGGACISIWGGLNTYIVNNTMDDYDVGIISPAFTRNRFIDGNIFTNRNGAVEGGDVLLMADPNGANTLDYNIIEEVGGGCYVRMKSDSVFGTMAAITKGTGNSSAVPTYTDKVARKYMLKVGSKGIDAFTSGTHPVYAKFTTAFGRSITFDRVGTLRPQSVLWDIGAYEFQTNVNPPANAKGTWETPTP